MARSLYLLVWSAAATMASAQITRQKAEEGGPPITDLMPPELVLLLRRLAPPPLTADNLVVPWFSVVISGLAAVLALSILAARIVSHFQEGGGKLGRIWICRLGRRDEKRVFRLNGGFVLLVCLVLAYPALTITLVTLVHPFWTSRGSLLGCLWGGFSATTIVIIGVTLQVYSFTCVVADTMKSAEFYEPRPASKSINKPAYPKPDNGSSHPTAARSPSHGSLRHFSTLGSKARASPHAIAAAASVGASWLHKAFQPAILTILFVTVLGQIACVAGAMTEANKMFRQLDTTVPRLYHLVADFESSGDVDEPLFSQLMQEADTFQRFADRRRKFNIALMATAFAWCLLLLAVYIPVAISLARSMRPFMINPSQRPKRLSGSEPSSTFPLQLHTREFQPQDPYPLSQSLQSQTSSALDQYSSAPLMRRRYRALLAHMILIGLATSIIAVILLANLSLRAYGKAPIGVASIQTATFFVESWIGLLIASGMALRTWAEMVKPSSERPPEFHSQEAKGSHSEEGEKDGDKHRRSDGSKPTGSASSKSWIKQAGLKLATVWQIEKHWEERPRRRSSSARPLSAMSPPLSPTAPHRTPIREEELEGDGGTPEGEDAQVSFAAALAG